jgi:hypothetical protein
MMIDLYQPITWHGLAHSGKVESDKLKSNIEDQLNRLLSQLEDLEDLRAELDEEEYNGTRALSVG